MNKQSLKILVFLMLLSSLCFGNSLNNDTLYFKGNHDYPPYQLLDENGKPSGFSIEILEAIKKTMGLNIHVELDSWNKVRYELEHHQIDGLAAMSYSAERSKLVNFSTPYSYLTHSVFVRKNSKIKSIEDIKGLAIIVIKGDIMEDYLKSNNISRYIVPVKDYQTALRLLSVGEYDCVVTNKPLGQYAIYKYNLTNLKPVGEAIQSKEVCFAVQKGREDIVAQLNDGLRIIKSTGEYNRIYDKWFGVYEKADVKSQVLKLISWIILPFILVLFSILFWSWSLRKQVAAKTSELQKELEFRKNTETQLISDKALLNSMINSIPDLIFYKNKKNVYIGCNEAFCKFNNMSADEIIGKTDFEIFPNVEAKFYYDTDIELIKNNKIFKRESWEVDSDGNKILLSTLKVPFTDNNGDPLGLVGICHDITERYKHEIDLQKAKEKAEASDRLKSSFLANMSHEIRTPMNAIIGFSDLLVDPDTEDDEREELVSHINNNCNTLLFLIDDIIDLAKIEANELSVFKKDTNIKDIFYEIHETFKEQRINSGKEHIDIKIKPEILNTNFIFKTDHIRLKQVLNNLLNNAFKYIEKGYVDFGYNFDINENKVVFYVKDTGIGIPKEKFDEIFKRFNKIETDNTKLYRGTGLGLTISQNLVERLGGQIWLESEVNKGSTFYFSLPYEKESNTVFVDNKQLDKIDSKDWNGRTILIAEDEESNYKYLEMLLKNTGIKLLRANNGYEAIDLCRENSSIDLVLMDIKMPELDGIEATRQIKKIRTNLPVIAQTAYAMQNDEKLSLEAGCDDYIAKPIRKEKLERLINKWVA